MSEHVQRSKIKPTPEQLKAELEHLTSRKPDVRPEHLADHEARIAELKKLLKSDKAE